MSRARHRVEPARRPLPRPFVAAAVGASLVALPLGLTVWQSTGGGGPAVQAVAAAADDSAMVSDAALALERRSALQTRDQDQASRNRTASPTPEPLPAATAAEQADPAAAPVPQPPTESTAATEAAPVAPEPVPVAVPVVVGQLWVTTDVNVRSGPSADGERIGNLAAITQVDVTGGAENGWTQVVIDGRAGWVNSSYLSQSQPEPQAASQPPGVSSEPCPKNADVESSLSANARAVYRAVCAAYGGSVSSFGGYRPGDDGDHGSGRAVDIMVSGDPGWEIARFVQANAAQFGVTYVIYEQKMWTAGDAASRWELMSNRGSATANHYDHVHVSVS